ncbi:mitochondrial 37S ribosomal protein rsm10 [Didymosphaeria variabile]|uniref:Mitochondrial 37S ribosomal protein rsm10 n=1 Tax=Didymosphaeria variabile TaxID=1932322 RepID=A0A9W9CBH8_9PLEO|nr:mitochondrial 37S ribosomal protein rsm10 [Didymosphaeria variabile]KAJ4353960.1 mitochondrial 37S ribosomal protein rsm10 [Didymosphaeria variabile]
MKLPTDKDPLDPKTQEALDALRTPVNVQAVHLRPLRRTPTHGVPVCDLQLRTYSIRNLLLFADFAVRAAYYMGLLIQIQDGHPDVVKAWLAFLQKHQYYGVGMKANIWEYESLEAATRAGYDIEAGDYSRRREGAMLKKVNEIMNTRAYKEAMHGHKTPKEIELRP